jgi:mannosyltransferase
LSHAESRSPARISIAGLLLGGILAVALVLRLVFLASQSLWAAEGVSVWLAQLPWPDFGGALRHGEANMTFYYTLLRFWLRLGRSEFVVRSLSVIFSGATVPVLYLLAARTFGIRTGLVTALLVALNTFHVRYAQEARSYSLVVFLVSLASLWYVEAIEHPSRRSWIAYIVTSVLAVYSHVFAVFVIAAHWASLAWLRPRDVPWRALLTSSMIIGVLLVPLGVLVVTGDHGQISWISRSSPNAVPRVLVTLAGADGGSQIDSDSRFAPPGIARKILVLAYTILCVGALARAAKSWAGGRGSWDAWHYGLVVSWLGVPLLLSFCVSLVKPMFLPYYLLICLPPLTLLIASGLSGISRRWAFYGILAMVVALASHEVFSYYAYTEKENWRDATRYVLSRAQPGDAIVVYALGYEAFEYYRDQQARFHWSGPLPGVTEYAVPWNAAILFAKNQFTLSPLLDLQGRSHHIWLMLSHDNVVLHTSEGPVNRAVLGSMIQSSLAQGHVLTQDRTFNGVRVLLYSPQ